MFLIPIRLEHKVAIDDHSYWKSRSDRQRRLDVQVASNDLLSGLIGNDEGYPGVGQTDRTAHRHILRRRAAALVSASGEPDIISGD